MDKLLYSEQQAIPRKSTTFIFGSLICIFAITCIILVYGNYFILASLAGLLSFVFILLLRWLNSVKFVTKLFHDRINISFEGKRMPQGMFISGSDFKASVSNEDGIEFPLQWVTGFDIHQYDALNDFGGWGERYGSRKKGTEQVKAFTAYGNHAIKIHLNSGKEILIGTNQPQNFFSALQLALRQ